MLPDYAGGSLVNLVASVVAACGGKPRHPVLAALCAAELSEAQNIVLVIIDGLGENYLARRGAGGELARRKRASITSVFPST
ncbi:MAG: phosphodiesterase, partial [Betaproteobacteria bacterium]